ncbi:hypothetical protein NKH77_18960 [Streptomyces sp. M19]
MSEPRIEVTDARGDRWPTPQHPGGGGESGAACSSSRPSPTSGVCARTTPAARRCGLCAAGEVRRPGQKRKPNSPPSS